MWSDSVINYFSHIIVSTLLFYHYYTHLQVPGHYEAVWKELDQVEQLWRTEMIWKLSMPVLQHSLILSYIPLLTTISLAHNCAYSSVPKSTATPACSTFRSFLFFHSCFTWSCSFQNASGRLQRSCVSSKIQLNSIQRCTSWYINR